jgi:hypothetical protein
LALPPFGPFGRTNAEETYDALAEYATINRAGLVCHKYLPILLEVYMFVQRRVLEYFKLTSE